jgi:glycine/D-amino acid oxidase-like deaminating enzyme
MYLPLAQNLRSVTGIAGLSTAISLGRRGHSVVVLESTKEVCFVEEGASKSSSRLVVEAKNNNRLGQ